MRQMKTKRLFLVLLAVALTGCGSKANGDDGGKLPADLAGDRGGGGGQEVKADAPQAREVAGTGEAGGPETRGNEVVADLPGRTDTAVAEAVAETLPDDQSATPPETVAEGVAADQGAPAPFTLASDDFVDGGYMVLPNVCASYQELGQSPHLKWSGVPAGTKSFALTCVDPDGGNWLHWVLWNIPGSSAGMAAAVPLVAKLEDGTVQGKNSFGKLGYGGPCPPPNGPHHYHFTLYALDLEALELPETTTAATLQQAMTGHLLGTAAMVGLFEKKN